jgi:hypothetical protein
LMREPIRLIRERVSVMREPIKLIRHRIRVMREAIKRIRHPVSLMRAPIRPIRRRIGELRCHVSVTRHPVSVAHLRIALTRGRLGVTHALFRVFGPPLGAPCASFRPVGVARASFRRTRRAASYAPSSRSRCLPPKWTTSLGHAASRPRSAGNCEGNFPRVNDRRFAPGLGRECHGRIAEVVPSGRARVVQAKSDRWLVFRARETRGVGVGEVRGRRGGSPCSSWPRPRVAAARLVRRRRRTR